ncbi:MAG: sugar phosphate isomerase/epimerase, partial [Deltaproteobacteria bacterium]|nr:sugar phosphate isomerase/epimerase [Deltaproteobacteria bacterium]
MIALSTGSLYNYGTARVFALAAEIGYDGIEVLIDGRWDTRHADYLRRLSSDHRLPIVSFHSPFVPDVQGWPFTQIERLKKTAELAKDLSVPLVVAHLPMRIYGIWGQMNFFNNRRFMLPMPFLKQGKYYRFLLKGCLQHIERSCGIKVALENMPVHRFLGFRINLYWFNDLEGLRRFAHLTLDTTHVVTSGYDPLEVYTRLKQRIVHLHLSNYDGTEHRSPVKGKLALARLLQQLAIDGYGGVISVEASPDALDAD